MSNWKLAVSPDVLAARSELYQYIRKFFAARDYLEVETPLLGVHTVPDLHIASIKAGNYFLQSSPEYAMKRLLASGCGSIFQICKAFRQSEYGSRHQPEFSMLEWYVLDFDEQQLMTQVEELLAEYLNAGDFLRVSYRDIFLQYFDLDPHVADVRALCEVFSSKAPTVFRDLKEKVNDKTTWLEIMFSTVIEPQFSKAQAVFVYDWPYEQAALSKIAEDSTGQKVAKRFELYFKGYELANGYFECNNSAEIQRRYKHSLQLREAAGLELIDLDLDFLEAQDFLPFCSGVALGLDRVLMLKLGLDDIRQVMTLPFQT